MIIKIKRALMSPKLCKVMHKWEIDKHNGELIKCARCGLTLYDYCESKRNHLLFKEKL